MRFNHGDLTRWLVSSVSEFGGIPFEPRRGMNRNANFTAIASEPVQLWLELNDEDGVVWSDFYLGEAGRCMTDFRFNLSTPCTLKARGNPEAQIQLRFDTDHVVRVYDPSESLTEFDPRALGGEAQTEAERMFRMSQLNDRIRMKRMEESFERQIRMVKAELAAAKVQEPANEDRPPKKEADFKERADPKKEDEGDEKSSGEAD